MGLKISELLKWKTSVTLMKDGQPILFEGKPVVIYLKVINDDQLEKAHLSARVASANVRKLLQDPTTEMFRDRIEPISGATEEECKNVIVQYRTANLDSEARVNVVREDLPEIEEFAVEPDAPTLEELEKLDAAIIAQEEEYEKKVKEYVDDRTTVIKAELDNLELDELRKIATENMFGFLALAEFFTALMAEKISRAAFTDDTYTTKAFDSADDFLDSDTIIKDQLIEAYSNLEYNPESIKK